MAFIEPMHRNKPNITYLLSSVYRCVDWLGYGSVFGSRFNVGLPRDLTAYLGLGDKFTAHTLLINDGHL